MNYSAYYSKLFDRIYISEDAADLPAADRAMRMLPDIEHHIVENKEAIPREHLHARSLFITRQKGDPVTRCPGSKGHICCNYLTVDLYLGCTLECNYCIMKWYLNFEPITVYADPGPAIEKIRRIADANPGRTLRIGTGEVGDSLLLDPLFELSSGFITELSDKQTVYFELKTKTDFIDHLLSIENKGNAVIAFSLNPRNVITCEEGYAVSLEDRFSAARRAVSAGYLTAFHFDPIIYSRDWKDEYFSVIDRISGFPSEKIAWISMGTFRYPPDLKDKIQDRPFLYDEFVLSRDKKYRYVQKKRAGMYRAMLEKIRSATDAPVYMCMESSVLWEAVYGGKPGDFSDLDPIFDPVSIP